MSYKSVYGIGDLLEAVSEDLPDQYTLIVALYRIGNEFKYTCLTYRPKEGIFHTFEDVPELKLMTKAKRIGNVDLSFLKNGRVPVCNKTVVDYAKETYARRYRNRLAKIVKKLEDLGFTNEKIMEIVGPTDIIELLMSTD